VPPVVAAHLVLKMSDERGCEHRALNFCFVEHSEREKKNKGSCATELVGAE
jgi:hypothetical protein